MRTVAALALLGITTLAAAQTPPQTIVFVCEHGAAKSVVAAAHFNKLAAARGLPFRAVSRGTAPDPMVPAAIANGLKNEGLLLPAAFAPTAVAASDVKGATRIVTLDVTLPSAGSTAITRWDRLPAFSDGYAPASAAIAARVKGLVEELERSVKRQ
jgi:arsenate reductase